MKPFTYSRYCVILLIFLCSISNAFSQQTIQEIIERQDLTYQEIIKLANDFIDKETNENQKRRYQKHFERWKYEMKFHLDNKGYKVSPVVEQQAYEANKRFSTLSSSSNWVEVGPKNLNVTSSWNPGIGRVTSVAVNPANTNVIYVSSPGGGIWKTTNAGTTWTPLVDANSSYMNVYNLCLDPSNANTIYAAATGFGVIKSTDAGVTWAATGTSTFSPLKVLVHPTNSNKVFVTSSSGIYESSNGGTSWTRRLAQRVEDIEFKPDDANIMYSSGSSANTTTIHRSTDGGITWSAITSGITNSGRTLLGVSPNNADVVYAVQANGDAFGRLYKSTDAGLTFTTTIVGDIGAGTNYFGYDGTTAGGQAGYDMAIAVNPNDVNDLSIAGIVVWRSTNGGTSFTQATVWTWGNSTGYNHADVHALEYIGNMLYSGSDGGIFRTDYSITGGNSWTDMSAGLGIRQFYRIANSKTTGIVWGGGAQDNGTTVRQASGAFADWLGADGMDIVINPDNDLNMIGTTQYGSIYRTTDGGNTRVNLTRPAAGNWVTPLVWHSTNSTIVYGGWDAVYRSNSSGDDGTWTNISAGITSTENIDDLAVAPSNDQYIYAAKGNILWVTTNGGTSWTSYTYPDAITDIAVKYNDPQKIWVTTTSTSQPVVHSTNAGATFTNISAGLPALPGRSIVVDDNNAENIFVGMNLGVYYRNIANPNWVVYGVGLPQVAINEVEITKIGGKLRVGTYGRGLWEVNLPLCELTLSYGNISQQAGTYQAVETITSQANVTSPTNYYAGKSISLNPPFSAGPSEVFLAKIQGCN
ncbi:MAG: 3-coathanger stack domain-containing protein [Spirosomataceae bacterium]